MRVALVTAIFGGYDTLKGLPDGHGFDDAVCITDNPGMTAPGWTTRVEPEHRFPALVAKRPKMEPHKFVDADLWVWVDGQIQVQPGLADFARDSIGDGYVAAFQHPERSCLYDEAEVVKARSLAPTATVNNQVATYREQGMPMGFGLWECAVLVWSRRGVEFGRLWLQEVRKHCLRDQLSFPYIAWAHDMAVTTLEGRSRRNPYTVWTPHRRRP